MKNIIVSFAAILLLSVSASAQIEGRVTDAKGNGLRNVTILSTGADGELASTVTTDEDGAYAFEDLGDGKYTITAKGTAAFQPAVRENVNFAGDETTTLDITLTTAVRVPVPKPPVKPAAPPVKPVTPPPPPKPTTVVAPVKTDSTSIDLAKATLAAHGGDKLINIKNLVLRGTAELYLGASTQTIAATFYIVLSGVRYRFDIVSPAFNFKQIYDGQQSYLSMPSLSMPLDKMGLEMLRKINEEDYTVSALPEKFKKKKGFRITSPEGSYTDFIVDENTNQVKEFESTYDINGGTLTTSVSIVKYREVEGVFINEQFMQRTKMSQGTLYVNFKARDILVNHELPDDVFAMPK